MLALAPVYFSVTINSTSSSGIVYNNKSKGVEVPEENTGEGVAVLFLND